MTRIILSLLLFVSCNTQAQVKVGAELLLGEQVSLIKGKRVGLVVNHTALLPDGTHLADTLHNHPNVKLVALFGTEHGIRGDAPDGKTIQHGVDARTGIPVYSLYGETRKPTNEMLKDVDVLIFDIQAIGARFYTFVSTMALAMESAAELNIPFIVLDRPNPIRGTWVEGFVREDSLRSFVGWNRIPIVYGMTIGELATMINEEGWLKSGIKAKLTVVKMEGWKRAMWYDETGLRWISPSPNMRTLSTATVYPGMCLVEGTNVSEGRGTDRPFEYIGAPFVNGKEFAERMNSYALPGVRFEAIEFTPQDIPNVAANVKHKGIRCEGVFVRVTDRNTFEPVRSGVFLLSALKSLYPVDFKWREKSIDLLAGTPRLRLAIDAHTDPSLIAQMWKKEVAEFYTTRRKSLLY
jgi:uncharacterized protein YbbC (DUF1343 family)